VSYFYSDGADEGKPQTILAGDRNITKNNATASTLSFTSIADCNNAGWNQTLHVNNGNIGLSDGSAQQTSAQSLQKQLVSSYQQGIGSNINLYIPN